ncbi:MAG: DUF899 family protein [Pseudomonadales bacterium]|nr:DUF899 family protein [Pseudomonadales bacterium]
MNESPPMNEIQQLEKEIYERVQKLEVLRKESTPTPIKNYLFQDLNGEVALRELFAGKNTLFVIHNMGQGCRWCTLWADGLNGFLPHLESDFSVVLLSKDTPEVQRKIALSRQWRFRMASHGGGDYISEQSVVSGESNMPGIVCYQLQDDKVVKKNSSVFGPRDLFCPQWHILSLAGLSPSDWTPQFNYWQRPGQMDDGGENLN